MSGESNRGRVSPVTIPSHKHEEEMSVMTEETGDCSPGPDFQSLHNTYTRGLLRGRHPRSFPRQSELWHHYKASNVRLQRISKGHKLWNVMDEIDETHGDSSLAGSEGKHLKSRIISRFSDMSSTYVPKEPLHGLHVDMKGSYRMHYGMNIVLINSLDEVLCVNQFHEVMCKSEDQLTYGDEICFRIVDLMEPSNPGPIPYGAPIWLQALKSEGDNSIYYGFVLGAKLFGPPQMESTQLSQKKGPPRKEGLAAEEGQVDTSAKVEAEGEKESASRTFLTGETIASGTSVIDSQPTGEARGAEKAPAKKKGPKSTDLSEICGALCTLQAFNGSKDEKATGMHHAQQQQPQQQQGDDQTRFRSRQASHLANWTVQSALKTGAPEKYVSSVAPIYLEQDLYCLATSHGNTYDPWPRTVEVNRVPAGSSRKQIITAQQQIQSVKKNTLNESLYSMTGYSGASVPPAGVQSASSRAGTATSDSQTTQPLTTFTFNMPHACLRRVVKRGAPYEHLVDRRCVWKFCVVDNPRDLMSMSVKEQRAQQLLRKARDGLNRSKANRLGGRMHDGFELPDGEPLTGGEKFPTLLRSIVSTSALRMETEDMSVRRQKEDDIANHIRDLFRGCDVEHIEDIANGSVSLKSLAKRKRRDRTQLSEEGAATSLDKTVQSPVSRPGLQLLGTKSTQLCPHARKMGSQTNAELSAGLEILKIHQSFAAVSARVTGNFSTRGHAAALQVGSSPDKCTSSALDVGSPEVHAGTDGGLVPRGSASQTVTNGMGTTKKPTAGVGSINAGHSVAARLEKKLELLSQEDARVLLALRHREQMHKRTDMGSMFASMVDNKSLAASNVL